jgi:hypothetical protein
MASFESRFLKKSDRGSCFLSNVAPEIMKNMGTQTLAKESKIFPPHHLGPNSCMFAPDTCRSTTKKQAVIFNKSRFLLNCISSVVFDRF